MRTLTALEAAEIATSTHVVFINRMLLIVEKIALLCKMLQLPPVSPTPLAPPIRSAIIDILMVTRMAMVWTVNSTVHCISWSVYNCLTQWPRLIVTAKKTEQVPIYEKLPNLLAGQKACLRKGEKRMEWEGREEGAQRVHYIMSCCANYEPTRSARQTSIRQKRPVFRIPYFRPSKCRPLESAAGGRMPPASLPPAATGHSLCRR